MSALKPLKLLSVPALALAALSAPSASAETLIYVTSSTIGTVDSGSVSIDNTAGQNGPLGYSLPSGFSTIGAKVSLDTQTLYLLASNNGVCQLFSVNTSGSNSSASLSEVNGSYSCSSQSGNGDFAFLNGSGGSSGLDAYLVANGEDVLEIPVGGGTPSSIAVGNPSGGIGNIQGVVDVGSSPNDLQYGVDASTQQLVQLNLGNGAETDIGAIPVAFSGSTSLDYSTASGNFYLYTNGTAYADQLSSSTLTNLGNPPGGTLALTVAGNVSVVNNGNAGAVAPALLLPLAGLAYLRRRRSLRA